MADITVTVLDILKAGSADPTYVGSLSVSNNYQAQNNGRTFIHVKNGGGSPDTVTIVTQTTVDGNAIADRAVVVPAGEEKFIGPFPPHLYNNADGEVEWSHSFITSVTHLAINLRG